jgi:hypothetical protein
MLLILVLFGVYWSTVLVWWLLASRLCASLRQRHPLLYEALGRPSLPARPGSRGDVALLRFLFARRDRFAHDRRLELLCGTMRTLLCAYGVFFLAVPAFLMR